MPKAQDLNILIFATKIRITILIFIIYNSTCFVYFAENLRLNGDGSSGRFAFCRKNCRQIKNMIFVLNQNKLTMYVAGNKWSLRLLDTILKRAFASNSKIQRVKDQSVVVLLLFASHNFLSKTMNNIHGLLRVRIKRGINLAVRDLRSSDPYIVVTMGTQKLKTHVIKKNCNPEWNEELTLSITNVNEPVHFQVYDKDHMTGDDKMGDAEIDIKPYVECLKMATGLEKLPNGCAVKKIQPSKTNCLSNESQCVWNDGRIVQDVILRLRNVECGEIVVQIEWIDLPGSKGLADVDV